MHLNLRHITDREPAAPTFGIIWHCIVTINETWYSAVGRTVNQKDHVLSSNRFRSAITDIRALRGPDIGSDQTY